MPQSRRATERLQRVALTAWAAIGIALLIVGAIWLLDRLTAALIPFLMAGIVVLLLRIPVNALEKRGIKRIWAVVVCYAGAIAVFGIAGAFVIPALAEQLAQFFKAFPGYYRTALEWWNETEAGLHALVVPAWVQNGLDQLSKTITAQFGAWGANLAAGVVSVGSATATFLFNAVLALVIAFWILKDLPKMRAEIMVLVGDRRREEAEFLIDTVLRVVGGFVRGQLIISGVTGSIVFLGLSLLGVPYALVLGIITGLFNVVPYVGPLVGGIISAIVAAFVGPWTAVGALLVTIAAQQITDLFVSPRVMSEQVDLHPVLVVFSLLVGATLMGFWGILLAIPIAAVAKGLFVYYYEQHTRRPIGSEDGALFRTKRAVDEGCGSPGGDASDAVSVEESTE
ncbi:MAG: AI-2E family transporter [Coriobacteriia bacterium]|nr:AI-2E family transporter [Coriobacteriia bacterium]